MGTQELKSTQKAWVGSTDEKGNRVFNVNQNASKSRVKNICCRAAYELQCKTVTVSIPDHPLLNAAQHLHCCCLCRADFGANGFEPHK